MPLTFHGRSEAFEAKSAYDEDLRFRVTARRDKLFARWLSTAGRLSEAGHGRLLKAVLAVPGGSGHDAALLALALATPSRLRSNGVSAEGMQAALLPCEAEAKAQLSGEALA